METTLTKAKLIEILNSYLKEDKTGRYYYIQDIDFKYITSNILVLHDAEIAKYKELVEAQKEFITLFNLMADSEQLTQNMIDKDIELRRKIASLESEVGK